MPDRQDFKSVHYAPEDDAVLPDPQAIASLPLTMHRLHVAGAGRAMPRNRLENSQCGSSIHGAELCLGFQSEWKTHRLFLAQHLFNHLVVAVANDRPARIRFRYPSPD